MARFEITSQGQLDKLLPGIGAADDLHITRVQMIRFPGDFRCGSISCSAGTRTTFQQSVRIGIASFGDAVILRGDAMIGQLSAETDLLAYGDLTIGEGGGKIGRNAIIARGSLRCDSSLQVQGALLCEKDPEGEGTLYCDVILKLPRL